MEFESYLDETILECFIIYDEKNISVETVSTIKDDALRRHRIGNLIKEEHKDASSRVLINQLDNNDGSTVIGYEELLSRRSRLGGLIQHVILVVIRQTIQCLAHDRILARHP